MRVTIKKYLILLLLASPVFFQESLLFAQSKREFFWDSAQAISEKNSYFPLALSDERNSYVFFEQVDKAKQKIKISWCQKEDSFRWSSPFSLLDDFTYSGKDVPDMYSAALDINNCLAVSVLDASGASSSLKVYVSSDNARTFDSYSFPPMEKQIASSRIFAKAGGGFILFISLGEGKQSPTESSFSLLYSESSDGKNWSAPSAFGPAVSISNAFSPFFTRIAGKDFVFFEGWSGTDMTTSLIYATSRASSSEKWADAFVVTGADSLSDESIPFTDFKNFRPFVLSDGVNTKMIWERSTKTGNSATVMVTSLDSQGKTLYRNDVEELNAFGNARRPSLFLFEGHFYALWFDDRDGVNNIHLTENLGVQWVEIDSMQLRQNKSTDCAFASALILPGEKPSLSIVWQQQSGKSGKIMLLSEDYNVLAPSFVPRNFKLGQRGNVKNPSVKIVLPNDISGIEGYTSFVTQDKNFLPDADRYSPQFSPPSNTVISGKVSEGVDEDQILYFTARVLDKAGNWSDVYRIPYYYDSTPPKALADISFDRDEWGFASSNDVSFTWEDGDDDVSGYSWTLTRIAPLDKSLAVTKTKKLEITPEEGNEILESLLAENEKNIAKAKEPSHKIMSNKKSVSFKNRDNGLYVFSVRAIDSVGNAGQVSHCLLALNKYKAATLIQKVTARPDDFGNVSIAISGQEFSYDGKISQVIITDTKSGEKFVFDSDKKDYTVRKDRGESETISGIKIDGMEPGNYRVQIRHSERGLSTWNRNLVINENGTVKYEKQYDFSPVWRNIPIPKILYSLDTERLLFWILMALILLGIVVCLRGFLSVVKDIVKAKKEIESIVTGEYMEKEEIERIENSIRVRISLKVKFGFSITALLLLIVAGVAFAIGIQMSGTQERILIEGLRDRVKVVMGNMASGVQTYLDDGREKILEIGDIVNQVDNFAEARFATILSYHIDGTRLADGSRPMDYVWATNDDEILKKVDASAFDAGTVRFEIDDTFFQDFCLKLNAEAKELVQDLSHTKGDNTNLIFKKLNELSAKRYNSYPQMPVEKLDRNMREYYFYWPVMYQKGGDNDSFLQAMILMEVSTDTLIDQIEESYRIVMSIAIIAALVAALIGLIAAFFLSSIIASPIRRIVTHVKKITETEDKLLLENVEIKITSHDELRTLGDSVNEMTKGLVKGARDERRAKLAFERAAKDRERAARAQAEEAKARAEAAEMNIMNLDGQAVQKAFIPLVASGAEKSTTAELKEKEIQVYGYYEGTDAVSGDYFDYKKLDDRWYAFIKCDASGHGVPAALIMTIVATIFRRYFADWKFEKNGVKLNLLAADINDFIESLGLRGKFAAMMICLLDTKTGDVYTCNAGDNILRVFDSVEKRIKVITLHEAPAAGPLPSFMVEMKGGYKVEKIKLKKDDVLFLYTDGIEESTRFFRNAEYDVIACDEPGIKDGDVHETHKKGEQSEQMEPKRVQDIIEAVLNKKKYVLKRYHTPLADERLEFDFSKCEGTIEEAIIALTAVEKVFRMYRKPDSSGTVEKTAMDLDGKKKTVIQVSGDGIKIDRKIDAFLAQYFNRYDYYCVNKVDEGEANYVYYTGVSEDVQADDLTLLAIKRM